MKRILIAFDGSAGAEGALLDLVRAGLPERAEARVLSIADVWLPPDATKNEPVFPDRVAGGLVEARRHATEALQAAKETAGRGAERLRSLFPHWTVQAVAHADSPAWGILAEARRWPAELVVLGSHGRSLLHKFFLGSVCQKVAAETECSVRVFRPHHRKDDAKLRVLIAVDGSGDSDVAVAEAASRKWPADTQFQLVTVVDPKLKASASSGLFIPDTTKKADTVEEWIGAVLSRHMQTFQQRNRTAQTHVLEGDPKDRLLAYAEEWKADTLFLGARGLHHGNRLYLGTFASAVTARAHCTVEIVRATARPS